MLMLAFAAINATTAYAAATKTVDPGVAWVVTETAKFDSLTIGEGAVIMAPDGYSVTMTVNGVETGMKPGAYKGNIVLTKTVSNVVEYKKGNITHYFRQALFFDEKGIVEAKSVLPAAGGYAFNNGILTGAHITSVGEFFNGIYAAGGSYTLKSPVIDFKGYGGNDFAGYGAGIMATGKNTTLVLDGAAINTRGAIRTALVAGGGANVIVKNSNIQGYDGALPLEYLPNTSLGLMKNVPWMLGLIGNCRATNLIGDNTSATYINSSVSAERWGVLSTDDCQNVKLTGINSKITITGNSGYGAYVIGNATDSFYGCDFDVADYGVIMTGGILNFGASSPGTVAKLNADLKLALTPDELKSIKEKQTTVKSGRFGVMCWSPGPVNVMDGTVFNCKEAIFLVRGSASELNVDGAKGVQLNSGNGIIIQMMDLDKGGKTMINGLGVTNAPYTESYADYKDVVKDANHNLFAAGSADVAGNFSNITLKGDFYNGITGGKPAGGSGVQGAAPGGAAGAPGVAPSPGGAPAGGAPGGNSDTGKNLALTFKNAKITGIITSSFARHAKREFYSDDYKLVGEVTNTPCAAINNGVIVSLDAASVWNVTGTSYLTSLTIAEGAVIAAPKGSSATMTVDGVETVIKAGAYKGKIVLTVAK
jgi:hypothetical protein